MSVGAARTCVASRCLSCPQDTGDPGAKTSSGGGLARIIHKYNTELPSTSVAQSAGLGHQLADTGVQQVDQPHRTPPASLPADEREQ